MQILVRCCILVLAAFTTLSAHGVHAQAVGDWETNFGDLRIYNDRTGVSINPRYDMSASGARREVGPHAFILMHGEYDRLRFKGDWWILARPRGSAPPRASCVPSRPPLYTAADDSREYGIFLITFNAAENSFTGTIRWQCRNPDGRTREGPLETFTGRRKRSDLQVYNPPPRAVTGTIDPNPNPDGTPAPGGRTAREQREWDYRQCTRQLDLISMNIAGPDGRRQNTRFVRDFQIRPCAIDATAFEKFQIDLLNPPPDKRPSQLVLRSILVEGEPARETPVSVQVPVRFLPTTITKNLPFLGVPRAGSAIRDQIMPGNFCNAALWLAYMRYSDGTESPPFTMITSECGVRNHPEQIAPSSGTAEKVKIREP